MLGDQADLWVHVPVWISKGVLICPIMATRRTAPEVCKTFETMSLETKASFQHDQTDAFFSRCQIYKLKFKIGNKQE